MATGSSLTHYVEKKILDQLMRGTAPAFTFPAGGLYLGLFTAAPSDTGGGTEVSGGSYTRMQVAHNASTDNGASSGSSAVPTADVTFPTATAPWGTITHVAFFDAATSGNMVLWNAATASKIIGTGDKYVYTAATSSVSLD